MKRITALVLAISIAGLSLQGCYGKMALTRKVYALNGSVQDKFVRSLVTWAFIIVPVYGVSALVDFVLFNTIEFWSGKNPVAQGEKDFRFASGDGSYQVHARKSGDRVNYQISYFEGSSYRNTLSLDWDLKTGNSTGVLTGDGARTDFFAAKSKDGIIVTKRETGNSQHPVVVAQYR
ncbi:hypothetical protein GMLC_12530 [Geomonas limicola]|uniref:Lipoprotein n=1 Tax=Geomonas limicola TaxID=2740186 RepID=A0A6V8N6V9_9BACT|nr:DUF3332 family protein [Geomonas limicola]GFO67674.1 hypothetical protein GMLC_12530 [Geomonas limicola]